MPPRSPHGDFGVSPHCRSTQKFQVVEGQRKPPQRAWLPKEVKDSVVARLRDHGDGVQRVAKCHGLTIREALDILVERTEEEKRREYQRGYQVGISRQFPPTNPGGARKAA